VVVVVLVISPDVPVASVFVVWPTGTTLSRMKLRATVPVCTQPL
jgi:hypothetical protein